MKYFAYFLPGLLALSGALALPGALESRWSDDIDTTILNFALTLEHVEVAFYTGALAQYNESVFEAAGFEPFVRKRFVDIKEHEETHVAFLSNALGDQATQPCNYSFPYTDVNSFAALASVIEGVGTSAYLGAAASITNKDYLTAAGSILATEARQQAWIASAVEHGAPWGTAFQTHLDMDQAFTLAAGFIVSCPSSNPVLPVQAFPALTVTPSALTGGATANFTFNANGIPGPYYAAFFSGLDTVFAELGSDGSVVVPNGLEQQVYVVVTTNCTVVQDDNTIAGPTVITFPTA